MRISDWSSDVCSSDLPEDVGGGVDQPVVEEIFDLLQAQPLDIHRAAADEMAQPLDALRGADQPAGAADIDFAFPGHRIRSAIGAVRREEIGRASCRERVCQYV